MVIMVIKQTRISTDLCIRKLSIVLHGSQCFVFFGGFHGYNAWLYLQLWVKNLRSRVAWSLETVDGY